ncbi:tRNA pseudouridine(55) synthase TruB [Telmatospirillum sp. J64-1]|uniref:tRNA pseudouridine(55) synthase TruB n=1 Tax=Telmatospirillum sp. J64-1 TaxID=2502183 RepID=UPI00115CF7F9|nr:tRNA pseudouridine(55) synthase TruB [Telmatospirillum sp. J64-1]
MGRKRKGLPVHGWLAVDKPLGMTSTAVVTCVRRITGAAKVGHGGTLDPLASGILPIALGEATKTVSWVMDGAKTYRCSIRWGEARSTDDKEGEVIETCPHRPSREEILAALPAFLGEIEQVPPAFSAVKVDGRRAYDLARAEQVVELKPRIVRIDRFELLAQPDDDHAEFEVQTGKGAYIRSLARDLAKALGTCGHIAALRRTSCGPFHEANAISLDKLEQLGHSAASCVLPVETALDDIPALALTEDEARRLHSGQPVPILRLAARSGLPAIAAGETVRAMAEGKLVALARIEAGNLRPVRVMNL